jgi:rod shape-determining protein MreC
VIVIVIVAFSRVSSPISSFMGAITTPVQKAVSAVSNWVGGITGAIGDNQDLMAEIEALKKENALLANKLVDMEELEAQNKNYEQYLGIKEKNPEMLFQSATVAARDYTDPYCGFTINVGLIDGVALHDPVITDMGLIGYIGEIAPTYSKVVTVLSPELKFGAKDSRTEDDGILSGKAELAIDNKCYLYNLRRDCSVAVDDYVITAGGSVFPKGLIVGRVSGIKQQSKDSSLYAEIKSDIDFDHLNEVMVITYFAGQGYIGPKE